ncbi:MAG: S9 family peptidase [Rhodospirillaceae bacterium]|nr:S9 family peptidase [Rhodospirillaceae bacterium]
MRSFIVFVSVGLFFIAPASAQTAALPPTIPAELFGQLPFIANAEISPDGTQIAMETGLNGRRFILVQSLTDRNQQPTLIPTVKWDLQWLRWASNDRLILSLGSQTKFIHDLIYVTRVFGIDRDGKNLKMLGKQSTSQMADLVYAPPQGGNHVLLALTSDNDLPFDDPYVYQVDVYSGRMKEVQKKRENIRSWYADADGTVRFGYGYNRSANTRRIIYRATEDEAFRTIDKVDLDESQTAITPMSFLPDPNQLIVSTSEKTGRDALYIYDVSQEKVVQDFFGHEQVDIGGTIDSPDGREIIGVNYIDDMHRIHWFKDEWRELQTVIDVGAPTNTTTVVTSLSADQSRIVVRRSGPTMPPNYYVVDRRNNKLQLLGKAHEKIDESSLAPMSRVTIKVRDGLSMPSYLTLPVGRSDKNLPLILMPHGGPWARDYMQYDYWVQFLANRGYAVLQPNFRGSTGYGDRYTDLGDGKWGLEMQDDLEDAVKWAVDQGIVDPARVCIVGGSYGGYAAMMGVAKTPDLYRCAVSFAGVGDVEEILKYDRKFLYYKPTRDAVQGEEKPDLKKVSPEYQVDRIKAPLLLVHGTDDISVPYEQAQDMVTALKKARKQFEFIEQVEGDHHLTREDHRIEFLKKMEEFLAKHNPA